MKATWGEIRLVAKYFGLTVGEAQSTYYGLKENNRLAEILQKARAGENANTDAFRALHMNTDEDDYLEPMVEQRPVITDDTTCASCGGHMVLRNGALGQFLGCANYPRCRFTKSVPQEPDRVPDKDEQSKFLQMLQATMAYIETCGGVAAAKRWLFIAETAMSNKE